MIFINFISLIIGIGLLFFSLILIFGTVISWSNGTSQSLVIDIFYLCFLVFPLVYTGIFFLFYSFNKHGQFIAESKKIFKNIFF